LAETAPVRAAERTLLFRLGLHRPELRAWAMYDWANSAFWATVIQIFPFYYVRVAHADSPAATANARYAAATTLAMVIIALLSPVLGAIADHAGIKKKMLAAFLVLGIPATALMFFIERGDWGLATTLFVIANIGVAGSIVFYESLLPHIAREDEIDRVSAAGYALGYLGSGLLMAANLLMIQRPGWFGLADSASAMRVSFLSVAAWWLVFSIPLFRRVPEPARRAEPAQRAEPTQRNLVTAGFRRVAETLRELRGYRQAFLMLVAFLIYNDGISTIIRMAAPYAAEIGLPEGAAIGALLLVQFVGIPFTLLFGILARRLGPKRSIFAGLAVYLLITLTAYFMTSIVHFMLLAAMVGMVMGGTQALSRSLFASMIPRHKSAEFFAFYGVFEKFAGIVGPALFAGMIAATGSSRGAIVALDAFFVLGGAVLWFVDVDEGRLAAREAEARAGLEPSPS
jgi:UMF1 family MFS transporter